jgi:Abnormal spindle-like microcephaly-assoc'd, ASPM-SPD-2-Hydin
MQVRLLPPPFGHECAADEISSHNPELAGRKNGFRHLELFRAGLISLLAVCLPVASLAAVQLTGLSCSSTSFSGAGTETCVVTLSGVASSTQMIDLNSTSNAVNVPDDAIVLSNQSSGQFTAPVAAVNSARTVTITAKSGKVSKSFTVKLTPGGTTAPALTVSATSVAFGSVALNTATTRTVTLTSSGTAALTISGVSVTGTGFGDSGVGFPVTLNPGQTATLTISFDPATAGSFAGSIAISSNAATATISLSGTGQAPVTPTLSALSCSGGSLTGAGTVACTVTLTSAATSATAVNLVSGSSAVTLPASVTIAAGATSASFTAAASAVTTNQTATLTATAGGISKTFPLTLNAATSALSLSSTSVAFGTDALNTAITKTVTLTSSGTVALTINGATVSGTGFGDSGISFPVTLNPGQTATLTISFDPSTAGAFTGSVAISSNATGTATISLSGTGQAPATLSALTCSSGSLTGAGTDACTATLTSAATSATTLSLASSSSAVTVPASVAIASGAASASFTATATALSSNQTATVTATAGGISKTFALTLNATVPTLTFGSSSVAFGTVSLNTPATQSVTMTSTGTAPITISTGSVSGSGFKLAGATFPMTLNPGQTATLEVQFDPTTAGAATGTVGVGSNCSMGGTMTVALSGTGATPPPTGGTYALPNENTGCPGNCRVIAWQTGSDLWNGGTLPTYPGVACTGLPASGSSTDAGPAIQACINSAASNTAVLLPAGSFTVNSTVRLKSNVVLRGAKAEGAPPFMPVADASATTIVPWSQRGAINNAGLLLGWRQPDPGDHICRKKPGLHHRQRAAERRYDVHHRLGFADRRTVDQRLCRR